VPDRSEGVCQRYACYASAAQPRSHCTTHHHATLSSSTDTDSDRQRRASPPLVDGSINRPLYLANARTCQLPRRRAGAQACNGCAGLWSALPFSLVKITRRRRQIIPGPKSVYPSRFARGAACGPSFICEPVAMIQTSNHLVESSKFRRNGSYS
jgi:hypothetical protein